MDESTAERKPSIRITKHYDAKCQDCGRGTTDTVETGVDKWATAHLAEHDVWRATGVKLEGNVYDVDAPDAPWYGFVDEAIKAAKKAHYRHFVWNGWVYHVNDFGNPVCSDADVPGLTRAVG